MHQIQRDSAVRKLRTNANQSPIALVPRNETSGEVRITRYLKIFYVLGQSMILNALEMLRADDVSGVRQGAVLDEKAAAKDGRDCAVR